MRISEAQASLFVGLPQFPPALPDDELRLLARLPVYDALQTVAQVAPEEEAACRRLERRGLVKIHRWKDDPLAISPVMWAGKLTRLALQQEAE